jgi:predicted nucleotidyltransferase
VDIDVFLAETPFQHEVLARRRREDIDGQPVWLVSPEDLVLLKLFAGRTRDIADIADILFTQGQLDRDYMRHWAGQLCVMDRLERVLADFDSAH